MKLAQLNAIEKRLRGFRLRIHQPDHTPLTLGHSGPLIDWHLHERGTLDHITRYPEQRLGISYVQGQWDIDTDHLPWLINALIPEQRHGIQRRTRWLQHLRHRLPGRQRLSTIADWRNQDIRIARQCLGEELFTQTAHFDEPGITLEQAQRARCRRLISDLQLQPGQHVLDLTADWGTTALLLAEQAAVRVTALFSTHAQLEFARREGRRRRLQDQVLFRLGNVHRCRGHFDRILANGLPQRTSASDTIAQLHRLGEMLHDDGFIWMQFTGRRKDIALSNHWLQQQLPARDNLPLLSTLMAAVEATPLRTLQVEDLSNHRERTLENWRRRFLQQRTSISRLYGEREMRHWEYQLASEETTLQCGQLSCYQVLLGNPRSVWPRTDNVTNAFDHHLPLDLDRVLPGQERDS